MGAKSGQSRNASGGAKRFQRLGLTLFGVLLIALFVGFAVAQGIGDPSVPEGDVALVEEVPEDISTISEKEFDRTILQQAAQGELKKPPKEGSKKYEELKEAALGELLDTIWIEGEAEELGVTVTDKQIADELEQIKQQNFAEKGAYEKFLEESKFTQADVDKRVRLQLLSTQIQERINSDAPKPTSAEISAYYDAEKATQFTTAASRDVRVIVNDKEEQVEKAKAELEKDNSPAAWKKVAAKYSDDPTTKSKGGLQQGLTEEFIQGTLKDAVFGGATGELVGPIDVEGKFMLVEVVKLNPEKVQSLEEARAQISSTLEQQVQQEFFSNFVAQYQSKWRSRTFCASGFESERCDNYVGTGLPANAPPACFEADPKTPTDECPAPVTQLAPALPGSVTAAKPQGERLPQRPRPLDAPESGAEQGLPEPVVPPTTE